jgi:hypothetical protein
MPAAAPPRSRRRVFYGGDCQANHRNRQREWHECRPISTKNVANVIPRSANTKPMRCWRNNRWGLSELLVIT